jgi:tripeptidyl-peptidase-1
MTRFLRSAVAIIAWVQFCASKPVAVNRWEDLQVKHSWHEVPRGWELVGPAPADHELHMRIGLKQGRIDELISSLYQVSDPGYHRYVVLVFVRR